MTVPVISDLVADGVNLLASQQAVPDEAAVIMMGRIIKQAYDLGCEVTAHNYVHDSGACRLCAEEGMR